MKTLLVKPDARPEADGRGFDPRRDETVELRVPSLQDRPSTEHRRADSYESIRNIHMMHLLKRIAARFNDAQVPLLVLKGAALNLTLYDRPDARPMGDLDLLVKPGHVDRAFGLLEMLGCLRGEPLVREDFFPRFYYESDYTAGSIFKVKIDLHVRPFRPLRYSQLVPADALWERAEPVPVGRATVLIPSADDMLMHLATHSAIHGNSRAMWLRDIKLWADARQELIDWDRFLATVKAWRLVLPVRQAMQRTERDFGRVCPPAVRQALSRMRANWRDRLALHQAPRDADHPIAHVLVNALCTPGWRFCLAYVLAVLLPDRKHMGEWYCRRHWAWLPWAHVLRWLGPLGRRIPRFWTWFTRIETRKSSIHGIGVFTLRDVRAGETIARYHGKAVDHDGPYVGWRETKSDHTQRYEITGKLKFLNHNCRATAALSGFELVALRRIRAGQEITIDYGVQACRCRQTGNAA